LSGLLKTFDKLIEIVIGPLDRHFKIFRYH
jgi:hypothetical protein